jgi:hypothetical protein
MSVGRVRKWNGEGYEAIVVIDKWDDKDLDDTAKLTKRVFSCGAGGSRRGTNS